MKQEHWTCSACHRYADDVREAEYTRIIELIKSKVNPQLIQGSAWNKVLEIILKTLAEDRKPT